MNDQIITFQSSASGPLSGEAKVPGDKSISHRALLLSAIAQGDSSIQGLLMGQDNLATMTALRAMGVSIEEAAPESVLVHGVGLHGLKAPTNPLDLGNSGTGMRLLAGLLAGQSFDSELIGDPSLTHRPMKRIVEPLTQMGAKIEMSRVGTPPLKITGGQHLQGIVYSLPVPSAQVEACLLLAGLYADGKTCIYRPAPTRDHAQKILQAMGCSIQQDDDSVCLQGGGDLRAISFQIPADISSAAFFMVAASIISGSDVLLKDVGVNPTRTGVITILQAMGANIILENKRMIGNEPVADIRIRSATLKGIEIPVEQVPLAIDELPVLMVAAACAKGSTILKGAEELRVKETDRIAAIAEGLLALGVDAQTHADGMLVQGGKLKGGEVDSFGDHRIAMAFAVAGAVAPEPVIIRDCVNVETSFPGFLQMANRLGLSLEEATTKE